MSEVYELIQLFTLVELNSILDELDIDFNSTDTAAMINAIIADLKRYEPPYADDCSDLLYDFLVESGYAEEVTDVIDDGGVVNEEIDVEEVESPDCYSYADKRDPACKRCKLFDGCALARVTVRETELHCFGKKFDVRNEDCISCLEAGYCRSAFEIKEN